MPGLDLGPHGDTVRAQVRRTQAHVLREAVQRLRAQGDSPALRAHLHSLLRIEGTDEPAHRELMQLDFNAGRWHAVLRGFERVNRELSVQLGLRPAAATCDLASPVAAAQPACRA
jgi:DNA-binding SARP family transcriptional activator